MKAVPFSAEVAKANGIIFYSLPQELDINDVDPLLRSVVERINHSGWVWTSECCQGHPDADDDSNTGWDHNTNPFMRLVVGSSNLGKLLALLAQAMRLPSRTCSMRLHTVPRGVFEEVIVYVEANNVRTRNQGVDALQRFSEAICRNVTYGEKIKVLETVVDVVACPPRGILSSRLKSLAEKMTVDPRFSTLVGTRVADGIQKLLRQSAAALEHS